MTDFPRLLQGLQLKTAFPHPVHDLRVIETHISVVLLTGQYAYKIKKPLNLGFLDFSTLERRRYFCGEELRLNKRLAPQLYLDVLPITGSESAPRIGGTGSAIEYALRMHQFDPDQQLDQLLARGQLDHTLIDRLIPIIVHFHEQAAIAPTDREFGTPEAVFAPMQQNFDQLRPLIDDPKRLAQLDRLEHWTRETFSQVKNFISYRRTEGYVRECHGDMHLGNMALSAGDIVIFDGIEFNDLFHWIDIANEIAFFIMDLESRDANTLAHRSLNAWLEISGDYPALRLMRFYQTYRATVRAKVASIRLGQAGLDPATRQQILVDYQRYADLAEHYTRPSRPALLITHGPSGSGKTTLSQELIESLGAVRIRSDVERKRLAGFDIDSHTDSALGNGIYSPEWTTRTYAHLLELARLGLDAGFTIIVDATFQHRQQRDAFRRLAAEQGAPFLILDIRTDEQVLRERIRNRQHGASEANLAVLENQLYHHQPLDPDEPKLLIDNQQNLPVEAIRLRIQKITTC